MGRQPFTVGNMARFRLGMESGKSESHASDVRPVAGDAPRSVPAAGRGAAGGDGVRRTCRRYRIFAEYDERTPGRADPGRRRAFGQGRSHRGLSRGYQARGRAVGISGSGVRDA